MKRPTDKRRVFQFNSGTAIEVSKHHGLKRWQAEMWGGDFYQCGYGATKLEALKTLRELIAERVAKRLLGGGKTYSHWDQAEALLEAEKERAPRSVAGLAGRLPSDHIPGGGKIQLLTFLFCLFASGCAHNPLFQKWDWGTRMSVESEKSTDDYFRKRAEESEKDLIQRYGKNWEKRIIPEESGGILIEHFDRYGVKIGESRSK